MYITSTLRFCFVYITIFVFEILMLYERGQNLVKIIKNLRKIDQTRPIAEACVDKTIFWDHASHMKFLSNYWLTLAKFWFYFGFFKVTF